MRPVRQTIASGASGAQTPVVLDYIRSPFNAAFRVTVPGGSTANFSVQYTLDDLNDATIVTPDWATDVNVGAGTTASATGNYMFPIRAVRVNVSSLSGGPLYFTVLQGDRDSAN